MNHRAPRRTHVMILFLANSRKHSASSAKFRVLSQFSMAPLNGPNEPEVDGTSQSFSVFGASFFCSKRRKEPHQRPRINFDKRSSVRASKALSHGSCVPPRALPGCCAIRAVPPKVLHSCNKSTTASPKDSTRPISNQQKRFSK